MLIRAPPAQHGRRGWAEKEACVCSEKVGRVSLGLVPTGLKVSCSSGCVNLPRDTWVEWARLPLQTVMGVGSFLVNSTSSLPTLSLSLSAPEVL